MDKSTVTARFMDKVLVDTQGCWEWNASKNMWGYGRFSYMGRADKAHRVAYQLFIGQIPTGMFVCHRCDNRSCVRPDHLFLGTAKDNTSDMIGKGRQTLKPGEDHPCAKLTWPQVDYIRASHKSDRAVAEEVGIARSVVTRIRQGIIWKEALR